MDSKTQRKIAYDQLGDNLRRIASHHCDQSEGIRALKNPSHHWKAHLVKAGVDKALVKNMMFQVLCDKNLMSCRIDLAQKNLQMIKQTRDEFGALIFDHAELLSDKEYKYFLDNMMNNYKICKEFYEGMKDLHEKKLRWGVQVTQVLGADDPLPQANSVQYVTSKPK